MLVWRKGNIHENCLGATVLCTIIIVHNGAQRYEQFLQVGRLYRALILLSLALSSKHLCVFGVHGAIYVLFFLITSFSLPFSELSLVRLALDLVD